MRGLTVRCLGGVRVERDGEIVALNDQQRFLLAVLAAAGRGGIDKSAVLEELFFDQELPNTRELAAVMRIRRLRDTFIGVGIDLVIATGPRLGLAPETEVDVWSYGDLVESDPLAAVSAFAEPFSGIGDNIAPMVRAEIGRLRKLCQQALVRAGWHYRENTPVEVMDRLEAAREVHPLNEHLTISLALAFYRSGRQTDALNLIAGYRRELVEQHGLDAGPLLNQVEAGILNHDESRLRPRDEQAATPTRSRPSRRIDEPARFVGFEDVAARLDATLRPGDRDASEHGPILMVRGPAGAGKSTVVAKVVGQFDPRVEVRIGAARASGSNDSSNTLIGPFVEAVPELADVIIDLTDPATDLATWSAIEKQVLRALAETGSQGRCIVVLEDLHDADIRTLEMFRLVAQTARPKQLAIVATTRAPQPGSAWERMLEDLQTSGLVSLLDIEPWELHDVERIVEMDHPARPLYQRQSFARALHRASGGIPLVATVLSRDAGVDLDPVLLPESISPEASYAAHIHRLIADSELEQVLCAAALIGDRFDSHTVSVVIDLPEDRVEQLLEDACQLQLCERLGLRTWRFDHLLTVAYFSELARVFRPLVFANLAKLGTENASRMLRYIDGAKSRLDDSFKREHLGELAMRLELAWSFEEAARAWRLLTDVTPEGPPLVEGLTRLAAALSRSGEHDSAQTVRNDAVALARRLDLPAAVPKIALAGLPAGEYVAGEHDRLECLISLTESERSTISPVALARWKLRFARLGDQPSLSRSVIDQVESNWVDLDPEGWVALQIEIHSFEGHSREARPIYDDLVVLESRCSDDLQQAELLHRATLAALIEQRPHDELLALERRSAVQARAVGAPRHIWATDLLEATLGMVGFRDAAVTPSRARETGHRLCIPDAEDGWQVQLFMQAWLDGAVGLVQTMIEENRDQIAMNTAWHAGISFSAATNGAEDVARLEMANVIDMIDEKVDGVWTPFGAALLAEAAALIGDEEAAHVAHDTLMPRSGQALVLGIGSAHFGPVDRFLGLAAATLGDVARARELLIAATAQAERCGTPVWAGRSATELASLD